MIDFLNEAHRIESRLIDIRRDIHAHPELGRNEQRTQELVIRTLRNLGIDAEACADTGTIATLYGAHDGPMVALRADMDALPIKEATGLDYASQTDGIMHACGHDIHTASLIGAAMLLSAHRDEMHGSVRFLFQPDEEGDGGARRMIDDGALDGVSMIFGAHVAPELRCGTVGIRYGSAYAASNPFDITISGKSSHGAEPHLGCDAIAAGCQIVNALQAVVSRNTSPLDSAVLSIGTFHAGTARNIVADRVEIKGVIRSFGDDARRNMISQIERIVNGVSTAMNVSSELHFVWGYPGIINHNPQTDIVRASLSDLLSPGNVITEPVPTMTTEDFGIYLQNVPGSFWHIGTGRIDAENYPLHSPRFNPDEQAITIAAAGHARIAWELLK